MQTMTTFRTGGCGCWAPNVPVRYVIDDYGSIQATPIKCSVIFVQHCDTKTGSFLKFKPVHKDMKKLQITAW